MSGTRTSLYIDSEGADPEALGEAFEWLAELGEKEADKRNALLAARSEDHLEREDVLASVIGERAVQQLQNHTKIRVGKVTLQLLTQEFDPHRDSNGPILAVYPDKELLDRIDRRHDVTEVLVVPWSNDDVDLWIDKWRAREPGDGPVRDGRRLWEE